MIAPTLLARSALLALFGAGFLVAARPHWGEGPTLGEGAHRFRWVEHWGEAADGKALGNTHGCIVIDKAGRIYANTDTEDAVVVFSPEGKRVGAWGKELAGGLHGMALVEEAGREVLYLTHTGRHQVLAATLDGQILWTLDCPMQSGKYEKPEEYNPTSIAVRPDGGFFVADGYGKSWIHQYDAGRTYVRSFGGPGREPGQLATPHGIWIDTRGDTPVLLVADRENGRLQSFSMEGEFLGVVATDLKRPCHVHQRGRELVVPELAGGVAILDAFNKLVARLGENSDPQKRAANGVPPESWTAGEFNSPHCARFDEQGNLYVLDWNFKGRLAKLQHVE